MHPEQRIRNKLISDYLTPGFMSGRKETIK
nr:MAG TPA: hypothetical protein [Caudoviricetes sp.]